MHFILAWHYAGVNGNTRFRREGTAVARLPRASARAKSTSRHLLEQRGHAVRARLHGLGRLSDLDERTKRDFHLNPTFTAGTTCRGDDRLA